MNGKPMKSIEEYQKNFILANHETYLMEASPTYVYGGKKVAKKIRKTLGNVKIIICLRNPVNHLFSLYKHHLRFMKCDENQNFLTFVQTKNDFSKQFYDEHLKEWFSVFGENIKCIFFEQFTKNPNFVLNDIYEWMGVAPLKIKSQKLKNANLGETFRFGLLHKISLQLYKLIKKKFPHKLFLLCRKIYYQINGKQIQHSLNEDAKLLLEPIFAPHLKELETILKSQGYQNMPDWISTLNDTEYKI
jgi:hypothetical protein